MVATFGLTVPGSTPTYSHFPPTQYFFTKANVLVLWQVCKSDNNYSMCTVGMMVVNCVEDLRELEPNVGYLTLRRSVTSEYVFFFFKKSSSPLNASSRYFTFLTKCTTPKACTILFRGPSKDILNKIGYNLTNVMSIAQNIVFNPTLVPGGRVVEMAISVGLHMCGWAVMGIEAGPFCAVADALKVIPHMLIQNVGGNIIQALMTLHMHLCHFSAFTCSFLYFPLFFILDDLF
jgi:T-complex protein 1 subunit gamma